MERGNGFKDETGNIYTWLRVQGLDSIRKIAYWKCLCDPELGGCGNTVIVRGISLRNGNTKSCGCLNRERIFESRRLDLAGQRFERYLVLEFAYRKNGKTYWKCRCDCGIIKVVIGSDLKSGKTKSCGCLASERVVERNKQAVSKATRQKMSEAKIGIVGEKHPRYNPNMTDEERLIGRRYPEYYKWHKAVLERDNYTCQCCGKRGGELAAHHLDGYDNFPELRILLENGITLCEKCHSNFHHWFGYGNNTREQFEEFLFAQKNYL